MKHKVEQLRSWGGSPLQMEWITQIYRLHTLIILLCKILNQLIYPNIIMIYQLKLTIWG